MKVRRKKGKSPHTREPTSKNSMNKNPESGSPQAVVTISTQDEKSSPEQEQCRLDAIIQIGVRAILNEAQAHRPKAASEYFDVQVRIGLERPDQRLVIISNRETGNWGVASLQTLKDRALISRRLAQLVARHRAEVLSASKIHFAVEITDLSAQMTVLDTDQLDDFYAGT